MRSVRTFALLITSAALLAACGVDTTGLTAASSRPARGNLAASVTLTEFGDFQCPACKAAHELINKPLFNQWKSKVKFEFKQFPLKNIHQYAFEAAQASECFADQGKFWEFVDLAYDEQDKLSSDQLRVWAKALGLNADVFERCVSSGIKEATVNADEAQGEKAGVNGTPSYFVNGVHVPTNNMQAITDAIKKAMTQTAQAPL